MAFSLHGTPPGCSRKVLCGAQRNIRYLYQGFHLEDGLNKISYPSGGERIPKLEDKAALPFCEATLMEVQRLSCVAPGSIPHVAKEDGELGGYRESIQCSREINIIFAVQWYL